MKKTFTIDIFDNEVFTKKLTGLQRMANKLNLFPPTIVGNEDYIMETWENNEKVFIPYTQYTIEYEELKIDGNHILIAKKDHAENLIYNFPNQKLPKELWNVPQKCEQCNVKHERTITFFVLSNGKMTQIGRNCLAKYIGIDSEFIIKEAEFYASLKEELTQNNTHGAEVYLPLEKVLAIAHIYQTEFGYTTKAQSNEFVQPTANLVREYFVNAQFKNDEYKRINSLLFSDEKYYDYVKEVIQYLLMLEETDNEFLHNLNRIAQNDYCTYKSLAIACYAVELYRKHKEKEAEQKEEYNNKFYGNIGDKFTKNSPLIATLINQSNIFHTQYGSFQYFTFLDNSGHLFQWKTAAQELTTNNTYSLTGTIKDHEYNDYIKSNVTVLTRCKII